MVNGLETIIGRIYIDGLAITVCYLRNAMLLNLTDFE